MNREIKFRGWNSNLKKFVSCDEWFLDFKGNLFFYDLRDCGRLEPISKDLYIIQQFTGLKDKNGHEIFEGDIIEGRTFHYDDKIDDLVFSEIEKGHVWYINGIWNVSFNHLYSESSCSLEKFDLYSATVIGNVLENPELLK